MSVYMGFDVDDVAVVEMARRDVEAFTISQISPYLREGSEITAFIFDRRMPIWAHQEGGRIDVANHLPEDLA